MKILYSNNSEIVIQANVKKAGDYAEVLKIAEKMVELDHVTCDIACLDESEQWVHICACWDNYQAKELREVFYDAKKEV